MSELTGGELVARVLKQAGVGHLFTLCGGHILPIYDGCLTEGIRVIDVRHEQAAAHAADAYARLTRGIGVALVTAGPGVTDAVTGVANAQAARSPLLLIGGAAPLGLRGLGALQDMDQLSLLRSVTKGVWSVPETRQIPDVLTTAIRTALSGRPGPVFVEIPVDLLLNRIETRLAPIPERYVHRAAALADPDLVVRMAHLLSRAERPVVIAGRGVYWDDAAKSLAAFAEVAGVPVFMNGAGRGTLPHDHPCAFQQARGFALASADVVLVLGAPLDFRLGYGRPPTFADDVHVCMVDADAVELGRNRPLAVGDGAFGLNGMEMETAVRFGLPMTCIVGNDGGWGQIRNPQRSFWGEDRAVGTSLPVTRFDRMVESLGGRGVYVTDPREIRPALERALASTEVWCINVALDPAAYRRTGQVSMAI